MTIIKQDKNLLLVSLESNVIKQNLISQLTSPVKWTQTVKNMLSDGATSFTEMGPGKTLQGLVKKVDRQIETAGVQ